MAVVLVGAVMLAYVLFGGMIATTWVQIIKAVLLLGGVTVLTLLVLARFGWNPGNLYAAVAEQYGQAALEPGGLVTSPLDAVSLGLALMLGLLGLPHILMRFYTVPDVRAARASVLYATGFIGYFYIIIPIVGFGAAALVGRDVIAVDRQGRQHGRAAARRAAGRDALPRFHRRRRLRHHPRRGRRLDPCRRLGAFARHLPARDQGRRRHRAANKYGWHAARPWSSESWRCCSACCSKGRTLPSWSASPSPSPAAPISRRSSSRSPGGASPPAARWPRSSPAPGLPSRSSS